MQDSEAYAVPQEAAVRQCLELAARDYVAREKLVPPLPLGEIERHAGEAALLAGAEERYGHFMTVLLSNELWRETLAAVPFDRRVLLLPQCLRAKNACQGELDELGLLCMQCGKCPIGALQAEAEQLGYVVLVAEGTTVVTKLLEQGKIDALIGVSCMSVLERAFPHMSADAIPGIAIPLLVDGCENTQVDVEWVRAEMRLKSEAPWRGRVDLQALREEVSSWFDLCRLKRLLDADESQTEHIALSWLAKEGKRWRPFLTACAATAISGDAATSETLEKIGVAVECFHKASLVHDDIEDDDDQRYSGMTLHMAYGVPVALNAGDLLVGEGYRLIAECGAAPDETARMLAIAAQGHRELCLGQGEELNWMRDPGPLSTAEVLDIFRRKTAPAFEVALRVAAVVGGAGEDVHGVLSRFSEALGIAYQVRDDIEDFMEGDWDDDGKGVRPSLLYAICCESAEGVCSPGSEAVDERRRLRGVMEELDVVETARRIYEHYRSEAVNSLARLDNVELKSLLRRAIERILPRDGKVREGR